MTSERTGRRAKAGTAEAESSHEFSAGVGERIRVARLRKGWTQLDLANAADLTSNYVARLERGELGASLFVALHLAEALGISLDDLASPRPSPARTGRRRAG